MKNSVRRTRIGVLRKRRAWLAQRVSEERSDLSYDKAELSALNWAIRILENGMIIDALPELEQLTPSVVDG